MDRMRWRSPSPSDLLDPLLPQRLGHPQPTRKRNNILCTFVVDSEKEGDEERRSLAVSSAITNLASPFPSSILSSLSGTVVWNAVTLALTPSKSRPGSADGEEIGFSRRSISPTGACPELGMGIHQGHETEANFHLLHFGKRVHVPGDVDILICPSVGTPRGPISTHARTRVKPFNMSSNSPAIRSRKSKSKVLPPTVCLSKFG